MIECLDCQKPLDDGHFHIGRVDFVDKYGKKGIQFGCGCEFYEMGIRDSIEGQVTKVRFCGEHPRKK